ncbi:hypothetical protein NCAS_0I02720 [Naumovozyma castellii]|uniref:Uncharacterized protein n=1 Tax=Naumovozyma castellii TaxID=27288 RepID=G0VKA6_NAUCA|nr:hypothetical protein NCAS_0I02720 [Naumovozyma castellii CBS 4309]CCC71940.1 hypothetical protein NCAS_0I02720 [Naumovozyma castellii CBS 4309]
MEADKNDSTTHSIENTDVSQDDFSNELAAAIRKSWSEAVPAPEPVTLTSGRYRHPMEERSPIGTPVSSIPGRSAQTPPLPGVDPTIPIQSSLRQQFQQPSTNNSNNGGTDYQLFKHHYSLQDNQRGNSVSDILNDLEINGPADVGSHERQESQMRSMSPQRPPLNTRRSSIQDVQWIRQLLNPRSSFSGASLNEPPSAIRMETPQVGNKKGWVTILKDTSMRSVKSLLVLYHSLQLVGSKYKLYVIYDLMQDVSELRRLDVVLMGTSFSMMDKKWDELSLFWSHLENYDLELSCYLSSNCLILANIDELLDSNEIAEEIDNETCVLLSNETNMEDGTIAPQIIIFRPNREVKMCIDEFFTIYGDINSTEELQLKKRKFKEMTDFDVLKKLFGDTWGHLSAEGYVVTLRQDVPLNETHRIIDFQYLQPWNLGSGGEGYGNLKTDSVCYRWVQIWNDFLAHNK